jgi:hypothetical protein
MVLAAVVRLDVVLASAVVTGRSTSASVLLISEVEFEFDVF